MTRRTWYLGFSGFLAGVALSAVMACGPEPTVCSTSNCQGCCSAEGTCVGGGSIQECGTGGTACKACGAGAQCLLGVCQGGAGGGEGTGGGSSAGGGAGTGGGAATGGGAGTGGGSAAGGGAGTGGGAAAGGGAGTGGGSAGTCGAGPVTDHIVISEVRVTPTTAEAVEIHNPTSAEVDLSDYWLYNATFEATDGGPGCHYYDRTSDPSCGTEFSDFNIRFPTGSRIGAGQTLVVALTGADNYNGQCDGGCTASAPPDFEIPPPTGGNPAVPDMLGNWDSNPQVFTTFGFLTNGSEDLVLYKWDGASGPIYDVDYFIWGISLSIRTDKTGLPNYAADTPTASQQPITTSAPFGTSYQRVCYNEAAEKKANGNGVTGHDETSEDLSATFIVAPESLGSKTPGAQP